MTLATHLQQLATPNTILLSEATLRLVQGDVQVKVFGPVQIPGLSVPVMAYTIQALDPCRPALTQHEARILTPFVGRERELAVLRALLRQVEDGHGQVVGIMGEPGIGKSRFLYECPQHFTGTPTTYVEGHCLSYGSTTPYLPLIDMLRCLSAITGSDSPEAIQAKMHRCLEEVGLEPNGAAPYLLRLLGVSEEAAALPQCSPQVIKARTFETLLPVMPAQQSAAAIPPGGREPPLDRPDVGSLAGFASRASGKRAAPVADNLPPRLSAGVDGQVLCHAVSPATTDSEREPGGSAVGAGPVPVASPPRTGDHYQSRRQSLFPGGINAGAGGTRCECPNARGARDGPGGPGRTAGPLAAGGKAPTADRCIIGKDVPFTLLHAAAELPEAALEESLRQLLTAEFLLALHRGPERTYTFKHVLTQEVAYQSLLQRMRQQVHARIAQVLATHFPETVEAQPERLAHHYTEAGVKEQAIPYWQRAGQQALQRSANLEAAQHLTHGSGAARGAPGDPGAGPAGDRVAARPGAGVECPQGPGGP